MNVKDVTAQILSKMYDIGKWKNKFMIHIFWLYASLRGKYNFTNMSRYGNMNEVSYRQNFANRFDFLSFNSELIKTYGSNQQVIVFDPSYLPKSGKHTYGIGRFWSGSAQQMKKGLELSGFSSVDLQHWTALHLYAQQTVVQDGQGLMEFYINLLRNQAKEFLKISNILCVDAYFSKYQYVTAATACDFTLVSRLRNDAVLRYLYQGGKTRQRGRPKTYDGTVDKNHLRPDVFTSFHTEEGLAAYQGIVYIKALKMNARVVILPQASKSGPGRRAMPPNDTCKAPKVFFSTDLNMDGAEVLRIYKARFQCEFTGTLIASANRQHTGLTQAQCRSKEKLHFHLNASLTAVSVAKATHYLNPENQHENVFSMADIKTQYVNELLLHRFINVFGIDPEREDNSAKLKLLYDIGRIAA